MLNWNISDHEFIGVIRKKIPVVKTSLSFEGRCYRNVVKVKFQNDLKAMNWGKFYAEINPNNAWLYFNLLLRI